jgi:hypothetical protein
MIAAAFKRLCCFPASELPAKEYRGKNDTRRPVGRRQGWLFSAKFLARKGRLPGETFDTTDLAQNSPIRANWRPFQRIGKVAIDVYRLDGVTPAPVLLTRAPYDS